MRLRFYLSPESTTTHDFLVVRTGFEPVAPLCTYLNRSWTRTACYQLHHLTIFIVFLFELNQV